MPKAEEHLGLAYTLARKFVGPKTNILDSDEYSEACWCLFQAANKYKPEKGEFSLYASRAIMNGLIQLYRKRKWRDKKLKKVDFAIENVPSKQEGKWTELLELLQTKPKTKQDEVNRQLLISFFFEHEGIKELTEKLGVTKQAVYERLRRATLSLKKQNEI